MTVGDVRRSFACVSLVVFAETYLDPKYGSIPGDLVEFSSCSAGMIPPHTPSYQSQRSEQQDDR